MEKVQNQLSRKKFLSWSAAIGSLLAVPAFLRLPKKKQETKMVKMLTQDGKLVMVDVANISAKKKKISNNALQTWVNHKISKSN